MIDLKDVEARIAADNESPALREAKQGIVAIEGLFFAINSTTYSPKFMDALRNGLEYVGQMHQKLLDQIGPEEVQKMKDAQNPRPNTTNGLVKPN